MGNTDRIEGNNFAATGVFLFHSFQNLSRYFIDTAECAHNRTSFHLQHADKNTNYFCARWLGSLPRWLNVSDRSGISSINALILKISARKLRNRVHFSGDLRFRNVVTIIKFSAYTVVRVVSEYVVSLFKWKCLRNVEKLFGQPCIRARIDLRQRDDGCRMSRVLFHENVESGLMDLG